jgi:hypothetical protein
MKDFIEQRIIEAVRKLLTERVNEILRGWEFLIPIIEFGNIGYNYATAPVIALNTCERTEKERIIRLDAYLLTISFTLREHEDGELYSYGYATAFAKALGEDVTMGGVVDRAVISRKKYVPPKHPKCGEEWGVVISVRLTIEGMNNAG